MLRRGDALLIVDVQNDFLPGGSLAVPRGDEVIAPVNRLIGLFVQHGLPVYASRDWHPTGHCSFHERAGPWPPHCVAHSHGAAFAESLALPPGTVVVSKAQTREADAYSAFEGTNLPQQLRLRGIERLVVAGLATEYCVLHSVNDALANGVQVLLVLDAIRAVDLQPGDGDRAVARMVHGGALPVRLALPGAFGQTVLIADEAAAASEVQANSAGLPHKGSGRQGMAGTGAHTR